MEFSYMKPVYFEERIRAVGKVTAVDYEKNRVTFEMDCFNEKNEQVLHGSVIGIPFQVDIE